MGSILYFVEFHNMTFEIVCEIWKLKTRAEVEYKKMEE